MFAVPDNTVTSPEGNAPRHPVRVAREFAADRARWRHLLRYDPDRRFAALIAREGAHEVWLLGWLPGQYTDLHDHGAAGGAFTVVSGELSERVARRDEHGQAVEVLHAVTAGTSRVFGPGYVHQVGNSGADPAISVHVYQHTRAMRSYYLDPVAGPVRA